MTMASGEIHRFTLVDPAQEGFQGNPLNMRVDGHLPHRCRGVFEEEIWRKGDLVFCISEPRPVNLRVSVGHLAESSHIFMAAKDRIATLPEPIRMLSTLEIHVPGGELDAWRIVLWAAHGLYNKIPREPLRLEVLRDIVNVTLLLSLWAPMYFIMHKLLLPMRVDGRLNRRARAVALVTLAWALNLRGIFKQFTQSLITHQLTGKAIEDNPNTCVDIRVWQAIADKQASLGKVLYNISPAPSEDSKALYHRVLKSVCGIELQTYKQDWQTYRLYRDKLAEVADKMKSLWPYKIDFEESDIERDGHVRELLCMHAARLRSAESAGETTAQSA